VGCAGWTLPRADQAAFPTEGSHLARYAARFSAAEINSSFHRPHRRSTWERWGTEVPGDFRFSVKLPRGISHVRRLVEAEGELDEFLAAAGGLGERLGVLLLQLPPSFEFATEVAERFFGALRARTAVGVACEPRHASWFEAAADALLARHRVSRVAADPAPVPAAALPGGWRGMEYHRLHGSPRMYYSSYPPADLRARAGLLASAAGEGREAWCIFDNTAHGAAVSDALGLQAELERLLATH
jgi:uncharacterized protein YecE (DUF72 family)